MSQCRFCDRELSVAAPGGHRPRAFCNRACKQAAYRQKHSQSAELEAARQQIAELEEEITRLRSRLDLETRYHTDTQARSLKAWLKKQPGRTAFTRRLLTDELFPARGSRGTYEAHLRRMKCSPEEMQEFEHLWRALLLS